MSQDVCEPSVDKYSFHDKPSTLRPTEMSTCLGKRSHEYWVVVLSLAKYFINVWGCRKYNYKPTKAISIAAFYSGY